MFKFFGLVLLSALAAVGAERVNINAAVDGTVEKYNVRERERGTMSAPQPSIPLSPGVKYSNAVTLGVDSLTRTGDCWQEVEGQDTTYDIHVGYGLLAIAIPQLEIDGKNMSAYLRIRDNSLNLAYTKHVDGSNCLIKLHKYHLEKLENITFGASRPEYDGTNIDDYFKKVVVPTINKIAEKSFFYLEYNLQALCHLHFSQSEAHIERTLMALANTLY